MDRTTATEIDLASRPSDVCRRTNGRPTPPGADFPHHMSAAVRFHSTQQPEDRLTDWSSGFFLLFRAAAFAFSTNKWGILA